MNISNSNLSFGSIHCVSGGKQFLERNLNKAQRVELQKLIESQKNNPINIVLAEHNKKRLNGWTFFQEQTNGQYHRKDYTQRLFFESPIDFIQRLCKKADNLKEKFKDDIKDLGITGCELHI